MNTSEKTASVTVKNYTDKQESVLRERSPFDWNEAKVIGSEMNKSPQSIVSKVKNMGLDYIVKPAPRKKAIQATKTDITALIQAAIDRDISGLEKSTRSALLNLYNGIQHLISEIPEKPLPEVGDSASQ